MEKYQQRVVDERNENKDKMIKLYAFFETEIFASLDIEEARRLKQQATIMRELDDILGSRITAFQQ